MVIMLAVLVLVLVGVVLMPVVVFVWVGVRGGGCFSVEVKMTCMLAVCGY